MTNSYILGIDTSNYKTSLAVVDSDNNIVCDVREYLRVKQGEKGLRQSDALFQHIRQIPQLTHQLRQEFQGGLQLICYSGRPRPVEGSYMPVFLAGESYAKSMADILGIEAIGVSHQEGHIEAVKRFSPLASSQEFIACHFSGGTCEVLKVRDIFDGNKGNTPPQFYDMEIIGGSKDISFGQVLDRAGVALGYQFPAGSYLDQIATREAAHKDIKAADNQLTPIKVQDGWLNLSGIDTQIKRTMDSLETDELLILEIFYKITAAIEKMLLQAVSKTGIRDIIVSGGVASSRFIRSELEKFADKQGLNIITSDSNLSEDNAVGVALLGGRTIWG
jgi:N6-L-threonylcarbamoyladenine synthase